MILSARASGLDACFRDSISSSTQPNRPVEVLDEPTAFLDAESAQRVRAILTERARKRLVLVSTHNQELIKQAGKVLRLQVSDRQQAERLHHGRTRYRDAEAWLLVPCWSFRRCLRQTILACRNPTNPRSSPVSGSEKAAGSSVK